MATKTATRLPLLWIDYATRPLRLSTQHAQNRSQESLEALEATFKDAVQRNPGDEVSLTLLAQCLRQMGKLSEARQRFEQALRINPDHADAHLFLANLLMAIKDHSEAWNHYETAVHLDPKNPETLIQWADSLSQVGDIDGARERYRRALTLDETSFIARVNLGALEVEAGVIGEARHHWEVANRLDQHHAVPALNLALLAMRQSNLKEALGLLRAVAVAEIATALPHLRFLAELSQMAEDWTSARLALDRIPEAERTAQDLNNLACIAFEVSRPRESLQYLDEAFAKGESEAHIRIAANQAYLRGHGELAMPNTQPLKDLEKLLITDPENPQLVSRAMIVALHYRRYRRALELAGHILHVLPEYHFLWEYVEIAAKELLTEKDKGSRAIAFDSMLDVTERLLHLATISATAENRANDSAEMDHARQLIDLLREHFEDAPEPLVLLGRWYALQGEEDLSTDAWHGALQLGGTDPAVYRALAKHHLELGNLSDAVDLAHAGLKQAPEDHALRLVAAEIYVRADKAELGLSLALQTLGIKETSPIDFKTATPRPGVDQAAWLFITGQALENLARTGEALQALETALSFAPQSPDLLLAVAKTALTSGEVEKAVETVERLESMGIVNVDSAMIRARAHAISGNSRKAIDSLRRVEADLLRRPDLAVELADWYADLRDYRTALRWLDSAKNSVHAKTYEYNRVMGLALVGVLDYARATTYLQEAEAALKVATNSGLDVRLLAALARCHNENRAPQSVRMLAQTYALTTAHSADWLLEWAMALAQDGSPEAAASLINQVENELGATYRFMLVHARIQDALGNKRKAVLAYQSAHRLNPDSFEPMLPLAMLLMASGELDDAEKLLNRLETMPIPNREKGKAWLELGRLRFEANALESAATALNMAKQLNPNVPEAGLLFAAVCLRQDRWQQAAQAYEAVLEGDSGNETAILGLTHIHLADGHFAQASDRLKGAPSNADFVIARVLTHLGLREPEPALELVHRYENQFDTATRRKLEIAALYQLGRHQEVCSLGASWFDPSARVGDSDTESRPDPIVAVWLAQSLMKRNDPASALTVLGDVSRQGETWESEATRAAVLNRLNRPLDARSAIERAEDLGAPNALVLPVLGRAQIAGGATTLGIATLRRYLESHESPGIAAELIGIAAKVKDWNAILQTISRVPDRRKSLTLRLIEGLAAFISGRNVQATEILMELSDLPAWVKYYLGIHLVSEGHTEAGTAYFDGAVNEEGAAPSRILGLMHQYLRQGKSGASLTLLSRMQPEAVSKESAIPTTSLYFAHGVLAYNAGHLDAARDAFAKVIRQSADMDSARMGIALCFEEQGNLTAALEQYLQLIPVVRGADWQLSAFRSALIYTRLGRATDARPLVNELLDLDADNPHLLKLDAQIALQTEDIGRLDWAMTRLDEMDQLSASNRLWWTDVLLAAKREGQALTRLREAERRHPGDIRVIRELGILHFHRGEIEHSYRVLHPHRARLDTDPQALTALASASVTLNAKGQYESLIELLERMVGNDREQSYLLARMHHELGRFERASAYYEAGKPENPKRLRDYGFFWASCLESAGHIQRALKALETYCEPGGTAREWEMLCRLALKANDPARARAWAIKLTASEPERMEWQLLSAQIELEAGNPDEARRILSPLAEAKKNNPAVLDAMMTLALQTKDTTLFKNTAIRRMSGAGADELVRYLRGLFELGDYSSIVSHLHNSDLSKASEDSIRIGIQAARRRNDSASIIRLSSEFDRRKIHDIQIAGMRAIALVDLQRYEDAIAEFRSLEGEIGEYFTTMIESAELCGRMAEALLETDQVRDAAAYARQAREGDIVEPAWMRLLAKCALANQNPVAALFEAECALNLNGSDSEALLIAGKATLAREDHAAAFGYLKRAVDAGLDEVGTICDAAELAIEMDEADWAIDRLMPIVEGQTGILPGSSRPYALLAKAQWLLGELEPASDVLKKGLHEYPTDWQMWFDWGRLALEFNLPAAARDRAAKAIALNTESLDARLLHARANLALQDSKQAISGLAQVIQLGEQAGRGTMPLVGEATTEAHRLLAITLSNGGAHTEALAHFQGGHYTDREQDIVFLSAYAMSLLALHRYHDARRELSHALDLKPNHAPAIKMLGDCLVAMKRYPLAQREYEKALTLAPDDMELRLNLAELYHRMEHDDQADQILKTIATDNDPAVQARVGMTYLKAGRSRRALEFLNRALAEQSEQAEWLAAAGRAHMELGETNAARVKLEAAWRMNSADTTVLKELARLYKETGDVTRLFEVLDRLIKLDPNDNEVRHQLVQVSVERGDHDRALRLISQVDDETAAQPHFRMLRAQALIGVGEAEAAMVQLGQIPADMQDLSYERTLIRVYVKMGSIVEAIRRLTQLANAGDCTVPDLVLLADCHVRRQEYEQATPFLEHILKLDENHVLASIMLINAYEALGRMGESRRIARQQSLRLPNEVGIMLAAAKLERQLGDPAAAIGMYERLLQNPDISEADQQQIHRLLLELYFDRDEGALASQHLIALERAGQHDGMTRLARKLLSFEDSGAQDRVGWQGASMLIARESHRTEEQLGRLDEDARKAAAGLNQAIHELGNNLALDPHQTTKLKEHIEKWNVDFLLNQLETHREELTRLVRQPMQTLSETLPQVDFTKGIREQSVETLRENLIEAAARETALTPERRGDIINGMVRLDASAMEQALHSVWGMVQNCTKPASELSIRMAREAADVFVTIRLSNAEQPGVASEDLFNPKAAKGFGMRLSQSRLLFRGFGGDLAANYEDRKGLTFVISLPLAQ